MLCTVHSQIYWYWLTTSIFIAYLRPGGGGSGLSRDTQTCLS